MCRRGAPPLQLRVVFLFHAYSYYLGFELFLHDLLVNHVMVLKHHKGHGYLFDISFYIRK